jgi:hypothetical protein
LKEAGPRPCLKRKAVADILLESRRSEWSRWRPAGGGACDRCMTDEAPDPTLYFSTLISAYTDAIRVSDFKANLAVLFVAIMMGPVVASRDKYPHFLVLPLVLAPFVIAFFCLLVVVYPRYPKRGRKSFLVVRNPRLEDFEFVESDGNLDQLRLTCSILSGILYWKTFFLQISFFVCLATLAVTFFLLSYALF